MIGPGYSLESDPATVGGMTGSTKPGYSWNWAAATRRPETSPQRTLSPIRYIIRNLRILSSLLLRLAAEI